MGADGFPQIVSHSICLRMFCLNDVEKVFQMSVEKGIQEWIPDQVYKDQNHTREVLQFLIQQYYNSPNPYEKPIVLGVCLKGDGELIGHVGLSPYDGNVEIGYAIERRQQNRGYASEAILSMAEWAFKEFKLPYIMGFVSAENIGSCKTLEKAGFALIEEKKRMFHNKITMVKSYKKQLEMP